jgi:hypothetical protein
VFPPVCWQFMLLYFRGFGIVHSDPKPLKVQAKISLVVDGSEGGSKRKIGYARSPLLEDITHRVRTANNNEDYKSRFK